MLVLNRKRGERLVAPSVQFSVTVLEIRSNSVRLGISAPDDLAVFREEVWAQLTRKQSARKAQVMQFNRACAK